MGLGAPIASPPEDRGLQPSAPAALKPQHIAADNRSVAGLKVPSDPEWMFQALYPAGQVHGDQQRSEQRCRGASRCGSLID